MRKIFSVILGVGVFFINGCTVVKYSDQLLTLKNIGDSQRQINQYIENQKELFALLLYDIHNDLIAADLTEADIKSRYGDPVMSAETSSGTKRLLYRHPTEYYTSDRVYFYIDSAGTLIRWEYVPTEPQQHPG